MMHFIQKKIIIKKSKNKIPAHITTFAENEGLEKRSDSSFYKTEIEKEQEIIFRLSDHWPQKKFVFSDSFLKISKKNTWIFAKRIGKKWEVVLFLFLP